jgi:hypothetical protein
MAHSRGLTSLLLNSVLVALIELRGILNTLQRQRKLGMTKTRFGLTVVLVLSCTSAMAQSTNCQIFPGGVIKCSVPQMLSAVPPEFNCQIGIDSISCSRPLGNDSAQQIVSPPFTPFFIPSPPKVTNFLRLQQEDLQRLREQADAITKQVQDQDYQEQILNLRKRQVQVLEDEQSIQTAQSPVDYSNVPSGGILAQRIMECGSYDDCDTAILHVKGGPAAVTGQNWLDAINQPVQSQVHLWAMIMAGNVFFGWDGKSHCRPANSSLGQAIAITKLFLESHPQLWNYPAPALIGVALGNVWPCHKPISNENGGDGN